MKAMMTRPRILFAFFTALGMLSSLACGSDPTCTTSATASDVCEDNVLYTCPAGDGGTADMVEVRDCAADGQVCLTSTSNVSGQATKTVECSAPPG